MTAFNPRDHYWINEATQDVFSSRRQARVAYTDAEYQAWLAQGGTPTRDPGPTELREVLAPYRLGLSPAETAAFVQSQAKAALTDTSDPVKFAIRNALRVVMMSIVTIMLKVNEIIDRVNGVTTGPIAKLQPRTWQQILTVVRAQIDTETDPNT